MLLTVDILYIYYLTVYIFPNSCLLVFSAGIYSTFLTNFNLYWWTVFEQMESIRLSEQKDTLLKRLANTEAENAVSLIEAS